MAAARLAEAWDAAWRTFSGSKSQDDRIGELWRNQRPHSENSMAQAGSKAVNEPSMEDILASIRRIIAEDYSAQSGEAPAVESHTQESQVRMAPVAPSRPAMPSAQPAESDKSDILDLNSRAERFRPPMPEVVSVPTPVATQSHPQMPRATMPSVRMMDPVQSAPSIPSTEPQGFAARAVSEFSERLGRSFAAAERYQRETQAPQRVAQAVTTEPAMSATVEAVAAAVHSHLAAAQAVKHAEPVRTPEPQRLSEPARDAGMSARSDFGGVRAAAESRLAAAREQVSAQSAPHMAQAQAVEDVPISEPVSRPVERVSQNYAPPAWLLSPKSGSSVTGSFKALQDKQSAAAQLTDVQSAALQELVASALRPMLKDWLDQHLPGMVERMITAEIQRVTRGQ